MGPLYPHVGAATLAPDDENGQAALDPPRTTQADTTHRKSQCDTNWCWGTQRTSTRPGDMLWIRSVIGDDGLYSSGVAGRYMVQTHITTK